MLMHNNYDAIINQGELLLANDPNTNPNLRQRLENEIQKLRIKLAIMKNGMLGKQILNLPFKNLFKIARFI